MDGSRRKEILYQEELLRGIIDIAYSLKNSSHRQIVVIKGCMFAGKSLYLSTIYSVLRLAELSVGLFKSSICDRKAHHIVLHNESKIPAHAYTKFEEIVPFIKEGNFRIAAIDEAQFFGDEDICALVKEELSKNQTHLVFAGLTRDFRNRPFGRFTELENLPGTIVVELKAHCDMEGCKDPTRTAIHSLRIVKSQAQILPGSEDKYKPICTACAERIGFFQAEEF